MEFDKLYEKKQSIFMGNTANGKASILIIYTGGTIGMVQRPGTKTLTPVKFDQISEEVPELNKFTYNIKTTVSESSFRFVKYESFRLG